VLWWEKEELDLVVLSKMGIPSLHEPDLSKWKEFLHTLRNPTKHIHVGIIGKYIELKDAYKSIAESFIHAGAANETKVNIISIHSEFVDKEIIEFIKDFQNDKKCLLSCSVADIAYVVNHCLLL
jgi:CTP synthase